MAVSTSILQGRIISEINVFGTDESPVVTFLFAVKKNYKKKDAEYYDSVTIPCKAFGPIANHIKNNFKKLSYGIVVGVIDKDDDYTNKEGKEVKGELYVRVNSLEFEPTGKNSSDDDDGASAKSNTKETASPVDKNPFMANKKTATSNNPFKNKT